jgi:DNA-binding NarL/FixJ family response regulator
MAKVRVLLVDDHAILREGLRALLSHYADVEVVGEAQDGTEALACVENLRPDVVLMDVAMPGMGGIEATQLIRGQHSTSRVLVLTQYDDWQYIKPLLEAGASGYITKRTLGTDLITAIRVVARGETFLQPNVASTVALQIRTHATPDVPATERLTAREREVLKHIALGKTNPQIALALSISVKTVDWHRTNLMSKLDLHSIADLVRYALQHGLVDETS